MSADTIEEAGVFTEWFRTQKNRALRLAADLRLPPGTLSNAWNIPPCLVLWLLESPSDSRQWWVVTSDQESDCIEATRESPRDAIRIFGERWLDRAKAETRASTGRTLEQKATVLLEWAEDPGLWG